MRDEGKKGIGNKGREERIRMGRERGRGMGISWVWQNASYCSFSFLSSICWDLLAKRGGKSGWIGGWSGLQWFQRVCLGW